jgi:hypothetical protein
MNLKRNPITKPLDQNPTSTLTTHDGMILVSVLKT